MRTWLALALLAAAVALAGCGTDPSSQADEDENDGDGGGHSHGLGPGFPGDYVLDMEHPPQGVTAVPYQHASIRSTMAHYGMRQNPGYAEPEKMQRQDAAGNSTPLPVSAYLQVLWLDGREDAMFAVTAARFNATGDAQAVARAACADGVAGGIDGKVVWVVDAGGSSPEVEQARQGYVDAIRASRWSQPLCAP